MPDGSPSLTYAMLINQLIEVLATYCGRCSILRHTGRGDKLLQLANMQRKRRVLTLCNDA